VDLLLHRYVTARRFRLVLAAGTEVPVPSLDCITAFPYQTDQKQR
jgi:hypothetical protein